MRTYIVEIRATITKRIEVDALNEDQAIEKASDGFSLLDEDPSDVYSEEVLDCEDVTEFRRRVA